MLQTEEDNEGELMNSQSSQDSSDGDPVSKSYAENL